jgi:type I restriction enzyme R subunit
MAGLPTELTEEDEEAKRTQLAIQQAKPEFAGLKEKIQVIASALEEQAAIQAIKAELVFIQRVVSDEWWEEVTVTMLETVGRKLRVLVKLIPKGQKKIVYSNFEDQIGESAVIALPQVTAAQS